MDVPLVDTYSIGLLCSCRCYMANEICKEKFVRGPLEMIFHHYETRTPSSQNECYWVMHDPWGNMQ